MTLSNDAQAQLPIQTTWGVFMDIVSQAPPGPKESDSQGIRSRCQKHWCKPHISQMTKLWAKDLWSHTVISCHWG